ncbi:MAG: tripartite tricarboxylate transporter TctB family protein [Trueperaceae bacterium]
MDRPRMTNLLFGLAFILAGTWVWFETRGFPTLRDGHPGPALFPGLLAIALATCGVALLLHAVVQPARLVAEFRTFSLQGHGLLRVLLVVLLGLLYPLFHRQIGFVPSSAALIFGVTVLLRAKWWLAAVVTVASTWGIYLAFTRLLGVPL